MKLNIMSAGFRAYLVGAATGQGELRITRAGLRALARAGCPRTERGSRVETGPL